VAVETGWQVGSRGGIESGLCFLSLCFFPDRIQSAPVCRGLTVFVRAMSAQMVETSACSASQRTDADATLAPSCVTSCM
jgi:hypothetical protein